MKTEKTGRSPWLKAFAIGAIALCILSIWVPWLSFGVKTDRGMIDLDTICEQDFGQTLQDFAGMMTSGTSKIRQFVSSSGISTTDDWSAFRLCPTA